MALTADMLITGLLRWSHITAGVFWIGLLYYFNVVQVPVFKRFDAAARLEAVQKLVPVALAWFRYAALATFVLGLILLHQQGQATSQFLATDRGIVISTGMLLGTIMFLNVWLFIWPNQKKVIQANREKAATGKDLPKESAQWTKTAFYASRTNFLLSFPMLFLMTASSHLGGTSQEILAVSLFVFVLGAAALWAATTAKPAAAAPKG